MDRRDSRLPVVALVALCAAVSSCSEPGDPGSVVTETFAEGGYDRSHWRIDPNKLPPATFEVGDDGLAIHVPAEATGGNAAEFKSQFKVGGNFDIVLEYSVDSLPRPKEGYLNLEASLYGAGGSVAFMRTEQAERGAGFAVWHQPAAENGTTFWRFVPLGEAPEGRSELLLHRRGAQITFLARSTPDEAYREIAALEYPDSLDSVQFRVIGKRVEAPVDVTLHRVHVAADHVWRAQPSARKPATGWPRFTSLGIAALLAACAGGLLWYASSRNRTHTP